MKKIKTYLSRRVKIFLSRFFESQIDKFVKAKVKKTFKENNEIILIFSIGKVGSSTVYNTIKNSSVSIPVFHIHSLNEKRTDQQKKYYKDSNRKSVPLHLFESSAIANELKKYNGKLYVITLIREPISREFSSLFQDSFNFTNSIHLENDIFINSIKKKLHQLKESLPEEEWFTNELNAVFGIDIYNKEFDLKQGYLMHHENNFSFCLIRLENLDEKFHQITSELFNIKLNLIKSNDSKDKFYSKSYKDLRNQMKFEENQIRNLIQNRFIKNFYSDFEDNIIVKWKK